MKKISYKIIIFTFILLLFFPLFSLAHSGRTDSYGGHWNHSTGTYHYHSGKYAGTGEYTAPIEEGGVPISEDDYEETAGTIFLDTSSETIDTTNSKERIGEAEYSSLENTVKNLSNKNKDLENQISIKQNTINNLMNERDNLKEHIYSLYKIGGIILIIGIVYIFYLSKKLDEYED